MIDEASSGISLKPFLYSTANISLLIHLLQFALLLMISLKSCLATEIIIIMIMNTISDFASPHATKLRCFNIQSIVCAIIIVHS